MRKKLAATTLTIGFLLLSCQREDDFILTSNQENTEISNTEEIQKPLNIPYTKENMQKAFEQIKMHMDKSKPYAKGAKLNNKAAKEVAIVPSHYYYRFLPKDSIQYNTLVNDTILSVIDKPMHLEEVEEDFQDENQEDEGVKGYGWQYSVLPFDYPLPEGIQAEKIEDMYFVPEVLDWKAAKGSDLDSTSKAIAKVDNTGNVFEYLELEALKLTGNLDEEEQQKLRFFIPGDESGKAYTYQETVEKGYTMQELILDYLSVDKMLADEQQENLAARRKWHPHGRITVYDDVLGKSLPVVRARVNVRKWGFLVIRHAYTDQYGNFKTSRTRTKRVKYAVHFHNSDYKFKIKAGTIFVDAKHRGHKRYKRRGWYQNFTWGRSRFYAQVHNAAYDFYKRGVGKFGLKRPNWSWIRISAKYNKSIGNHLDLNPNGQIPWVFPLSLYSEIRVGRLGRGNTALRSDELYATVVHEMGHASHYRLDRTFFANPRGAGCTLQTMAESWAEGIETELTNDRYLSLDRNYRGSNRLFGSYGGYEKRYNSLRQNNVIRKGSNEQYTPIVIDLIDNFNQKIKIANSKHIDRVKGYTLKQIQKSLEHSRGPHTWKEKIKKQHYNTSAKYVDELFGEYMYDNCK